MSKEIQKELKSITSYLTKQEKDKVIDALRLSQEAHSNQLRKSGDPFITHPLEVAKILTSIKLDADSIVAGLLHDTLEDTNLDIEEINKKFGNEIVELVESDPFQPINPYPSPEIAVILTEVPSLYVPPVVETLPPSPADTVIVY